MKRAKEQVLVDNSRRPKMHLGESDVDFVNLNGSSKRKVLSQKSYRLNNFFIHSRSIYKKK